MFKTSSAKSYIPLLVILVNALQLYVNIQWYSWLLAVSYIFLFLFFINLLLNKFVSLHISFELVVGFHLKTFATNWMRFVCQQSTFIYIQIPILILHRNTFILSSEHKRIIKMKNIGLTDHIHFNAFFIFSTAPNVCGTNIFRIWIYFQSRHINSNDGFAFSYQNFDFNSPTFKPYRLNGLYMYSTCKLEKWKLCEHLREHVHFFFPTWKISI